MRRHRRERLRSAAVMIGTSFAAGALVDTALTARLGRSPAEQVAQVHAPSSTDPAPVPALANAPDTAAPRESLTAKAQVPRPAAAPAPIRNPIAVLRARDLKFPIEDYDEDDLIDTFSQKRGTRVHEALDIMAPRHTPVRAVDDGTIAKLFTSKAGGVTIYQFDPTRTFTYYYAHLDRYERSLREGQAVERGDTIGYVGSTGNASPDAPHLHFAIFMLTSEKVWSKGAPVNPFPVFRDDDDS